MKRFFEGAWLGHPLHPLLVELPVSLWPAAFVLDLLTLLGIGGNPLVKTAFLAVLVGVVAAAPAALAGVLDWSGVKREKPAWRLGLIHLILNACATTLAIASLILRISGLGADRVDWLPVLLIGGVTLLVGVSSYLGGRMVYDYGVSVARLTKDYWRRVADQGRPSDRSPGEEAS